MICITSSRYKGVKISPQAGALHLDIEVGGFGAVLATTATPTSDPGLATLLAIMSNMTRSLLASYSSEWQFLQQNMVDVGKTPLANPLPSGMVTVPGGHYRFAVQGVEIEGADTSLYDNSFGVDVQYPFEPHPRFDFTPETSLFCNHNNPNQCP